MARAVWTGALTFGLVNIPVRLYRATEDRSIRFHQIQRGTRDRIRYRRVNERTGEEVQYEDIVKGYPLGDEEYVIVEPEELESVAPGRSRTLDVAGFVDLDEVDPIYYQTTYYLAPQSEEHAHTYAVLRDALHKQNRAAVAMFVMRDKQHLAVVRPDGEVLAVETLYYADEVREPRAELANLPADGGVREAELDQATQLVEAMAVAWRPEEYRDVYRERVAELVESKRTGERVTPEEGPGEGTKVVDLMDALQRSVASARRSRGRSESRTPSRRGRGREDLSSLSKSALYRRAGELGVAGRSRMGRAELERAVAASEKEAG